MKGNGDDRETWSEVGRLAELGLLASELVHELRQPIFAVKALAQIVEHHVDGDSRQRMTELLEQLRVMENLLDRYAISTRRPVNMKGPVELVQAVKDGAAVLRHRAADSRRVLEVIPDTQAVLVVGDPVAIQQVTTNLVLNALDAATDRVTVRVQGLSLVVEDDGPGIPENVSGQVFEPFFTTKPPGEGTGLGLFIARRLVQACDGELRHTSDAGGTRFTATFNPWRRTEGS